MNVYERQRRIAERTKRIVSDSRLYKLAGNAVTVNVIFEIGKIIKKVNDKN
ncbi:hypothetical protein [Ruminococcus sp.]|uniref:hypothetical protein n=1 Tax=Ruminococcus sp. TaxID=41978 RepID=UPI003F007B9F